LGKEEAVRGARSGPRLAQGCGSVPGANGACWRGRNAPAAPISLLWSPHVKKDASFFHFSIGANQRALVIISADQRQHPGHWVPATGRPSELPSSVWV